MCGIAGIYQWRRRSFDGTGMTEIVRGMISTMVHRGPDADGLWSDLQGRCVLGHRRLSIIDTSDAGRQPMATSDGRWLITFNGELYNFQALRACLDECRHRAARPDRHRSPDGIARALRQRCVLASFDGMFAFAAFDTLTGEMLLARDPFGEKPLYYMELPDSALAFASELQALERLPGFDGTVDIDGMAEVLIFQYIGAPRTDLPLRQKAAARLLDAD